MRRERMFGRQKSQEIRSTGSRRDFYLIVSSSPWCKPAINYRLPKRIILDDPTCEKELFLVACRVWIQEVVKLIELNIKNRICLEFFLLFELIRLANNQVGVIRLTISSQVKTFRPQKLYLLGLLISKNFPGP